jgi:hypothetical protein
MRVYVTWVLWAVPALFALWALLVLVFGVGWGVGGTSIG